VWGLAEKNSAAGVEAAEDVLARLGVEFVDGGKKFVEFFGGEISLDFVAADADAGEVVEGVEAGSG